jgi:hypothetical protein
MNELTKGIWEDFTSALGDNRIFDAEILLGSVDEHKSESAWEDLIVSMYDEWALFLVGKSEFNNHENGVCV